MNRKGQGGPRGLTVFDTLLVCILVAALMAVFMEYYERTIRGAREVALRTGLENIRLSIRFYHSANGKFPGDLRELLAGHFLVPIKDGTFYSDRYLRMQAQDPAGYPVDPFGQKYQYDPVNGSVRSSTEGYQHW